MFALSLPCKSHAVGPSPVRSKSVRVMILGLLFFLGPTCKSHAVGPSPVRLKSFRVVTLHLSSFLLALRPVKLNRFSSNSSTEDAFYHIPTGPFSERHHRICGFEFKELPEGRRGVPCIWELTRRKVRDLREIRDWVRLFCRSSASCTLHGSCASWPSWLVLAVG
jgi:hypothetical protein